MEVELCLNRLDDDHAATNLSSLDHYKARPDIPLFNSLTLLKFMQEYKVTKGDESRPTCRAIEVVVIVRPFLSPEPDGPKYEQYCKQKLMLHKPFRLENDLLENHLTFTEAFASFLSTGNVPPSLADDVDRLEHQVSEQSEDNTTESDTTTTELDRNRRYVQEWMLLCQRLPDLGANSSNTHDEVDWLEAGRHVPNLEESCTFITRHKESGFLSSSQSPSADPQLLQGKQLEAYQAVQQHRLNRRGTALRMIVSGTAGTGKSFLINCLTNLLGPHVKVSAPTGVAATKIHGGTLHSLLHIPTRGEFRDLEGDRLKALQTAFEGVQFLITDEMSMVGRKCSVR